jgi:cytochrome b involved in lipid metabolism
MNQNKSLPYIIAAIIIALVVIIVSAQNSDKNESPTVESNEQTSSPVETTNENKEPVTVKVVPDPLEGPYTMATVSTHNSATSCWTVINGNVYNLTSWINKHPGGKQAIMGTCGKDASSYFNAQHGGQQGPVSTLASFKIGVLSK